MCFKSRRRNTNKNENYHSDTRAPWYVCRSVSRNIMRTLGKPDDARRYVRSPWRSGMFWVCWLFWSARYGTRIIHGGRLAIDRRWRSPFCPLFSYSHVVRSFPWRSVHDVTSRWATYGPVRECIGALKDPMKRSKYCRKMFNCAFSIALINIHTIESYLRESVFTIRVYGSIEQNWN